MLLLSESGVYKVALLSRKPEGRRLRNWIAKEVLPEIKRTGQYVMDIAPDVAASAVQHHLERVAELETRVAALIEVQPLGGERMLLVSWLMSGSMPQVMQQGVLVPLTGEALAWYKRGWGSVDEIFASSRFLASPPVGTDSLPSAGSPAAPPAPASSTPVQKPPARRPRKTAAAPPAPKPKAAPPPPLPKTAKPTTSKGKPAPTPAAPPASRPRKKGARPPQPRTADPNTDPRRSAPPTVPRTRTTHPALDAVKALCKLGHPAEAVRDAVNEVLARQPNASLEVLLREALRALGRN